MTVENITANNKKRDSFLEAGLVLSAELLVDSVFGTFASGVISAKNTYKLEKFKENILIMINDLNEKMKDIDENFKLLMNQENLDTALLLDALENEVEQEKIQLFVNGIINVYLETEIEVELKLAYHEALKNLRVFEIKHFLDVYYEKNYKVYFQEGYQNGGEIIDESNEYHIYVRSKLLNLGILFKENASWDGVTDEDFVITKFGNGMIDYFKLYTT